VTSENDNLFKSYVGVQLTEKYTPDCLLNYVTLDFTYAYPTGSSQNIYPVTKPTITQ
jgi:hypothetical protein